MLRGGEGGCREGGARRGPQRRSRCAAEAATRQQARFAASRVSRLAPAMPLQWPLRGHNGEEGRLQGRGGRGPQRRSRCAAEAATRQQARFAADLQMEINGKP